MDILGLLELQGRLFLLMGVGMFLRRRLLSEAFQKGLTDLIVDLILPCSILTAFGTEPREDLLRSVLFTLVLSTIIQIGCALIAAALFRRSPANRRPVLSYGTICSNAGFLGTPVAESVFGPEGVLLASVFLIPQRAFMWTLGVSYFTKGGGHGWKKVLTNPCILAVLAGTALWAAQVDLPPVLDGAVRSLGSCNTGLSMLLIGMLMSGFHWRDLADPGILCFCGVRLVLIPFLTPRGMPHLPRGGPGLPGVPPADGHARGGHHRRPGRQVWRRRGVCRRVHHRVHLPLDDYHPPVVRRGPLRCAKGCGRCFFIQNRQGRFVGNNKKFGNSWNV